MSKKEYNKSIKRKGELMMRNFLFRDEETGEEFFVQEDTLEKAKEIASDIFSEPTFISIFSDVEAEWAGLDTY